MTMCVMSSSFFLCACIVIFVCVGSGWDEPERISVTFFYLKLLSWLMLLRLEDFMLLEVRLE